MSMNLLAVQDQITAKLSELSQDVYETSAPDDSKLTFDANGNLLPYVVVQYSDMYPTGIGGGVIGEQYNVAQSYCIVTCVSTNQRASRQLADAVRAKLIGFKPTDGGELRFAGGAIDYSNPDVKPNRYTAELGFTFAVNTVW
jgi:hypothetical protein